MKLSLVTLSLNQKQFLSQTLDSVLDQDYPDIEYIVVDPGSTDGSQELLVQYRPRLTQLILEPDKGPADGLNKGFRLATGDVYGFLNSDDYLLPAALREVAAYFSSHPKCDVLLGDGFLVDVEGKVLRHIRARGFTTLRVMSTGSRWLQQSVFFRRQAFDATGGFNPTNRYSWDGELFLTMVGQGAKFEYLHRDLSCFRMHGESISTRLRKGGGDTFMVGYRREHERLFRRFMGRQLDFRDALLASYFRLEGLVRYPNDLVEAVLHRVRSRRA